MRRKKAYFIEFTDPSGKKKFVGHGTKERLKPPFNRNLYANKDSAEYEIKTIKRDNVNRSYFKRLKLREVLV